jgi:hypothetical protein
LQGKEQDVAFLQEMIPGLSTVAAVLAMEKNYYNMVRELSFTTKLCRAVLCLWGALGASANCVL